MSGRQRVRRRVWLRGGGMCWLCRCPVPLIDVTLDHVVPKSKGGRDSMVNYRPAHRECNMRRRDADPPSGVAHPLATRGAARAVMVKKWKRKLSTDERIAIQKRIEEACRANASATTLPPSGSETLRPRAGRGAEEPALSEVSYVEEKSEPKRGAPARGNKKSGGERP